MARVFVVLTGEQCEGGRVIGVFASKDSAVVAALATESAFGGWESDGSTDFWTSGCDFLAIEEHEVQP